MGHPPKTSRQALSVARRLDVAGVRIGPGAIEFARIQCGAPSNASCRVIAMTPPFPAQCDEAPIYSRPRLPAEDSVLILAQIGRASRRESVCQYVLISVVDDSLKK